MSTAVNFAPTVPNTTCGPWSIAANWAGGVIPGSPATDLLPTIPTGKTCIADYTNAVPLAGLVITGTGLLAAPIPYKEMIKADGPIRYWRLGEAAGVTAVDEMGLGNGTYINAPTLGAAGALLGDTDKAVTFAAASLQYVQCGDTSVCEDGTFTYECWIKCTAAEAGNIVGEFSSLSDNLFATMLVTTGQLFVWIKSGVGQENYRLSVTSVNTGAWVHIVLVCDGNNLLSYINGVANSPVPLTIAFPAVNRTAIGAYWKAVASAYFNGTIDEVAIYNKALTPAQILAHYYAGPVNSTTTKTLTMAGNISGTGYLAANSDYTAAGTGNYPLACVWNRDFGATAYGNTVALINTRVPQPTDYFARLIASDATLITAITLGATVVVTSPGHAFGAGGTTADAVIVCSAAHTTAAVTHPFYNLKVKITVVDATRVTVKWFDSNLTPNADEQAKFPAFASVSGLGNWYLSKLVAATGGVTIDLFTDRDLTTAGNAPWYATNTDKLINIDNVNRAKQSEQRTIAGVTATRVTVTAWVTADKNAGSLLCLLARNVKTTGSGGSYFYSAQVATNYIGDEILHTAVANNSAVAIYNVSYCTFVGTIAGIGFTSGLQNCTSVVSTGLLSGNLTYACYACISCTVGGVISGSGYGFYSGGACSYTGLMSGLTYGSFVGVGAGNTFSGFCNGSLAGMTGAFIANTGTTSNCAAGIYSLIGGNFSGMVVGCQYGIQAPGQFTVNGGVFLGNQVEVYEGTVNQYLSFIGYGTYFLSAASVSSYKQTMLTGNQQILIWDFNGHVGTEVGYKPNGNIAAWMPSGKVLTAADANITALMPSADSSLTFTFEQTNTPVFLDVPLSGKAGVPITVTVALKQSIALTDGPRIQFIDPAQPIFSAASVLSEDVVGFLDTAYHLRTLTYTPLRNGPLILRFRGTNASGTMNLNWIITTGTLVQWATDIQSGGVL